MKKAIAITFAVIGGGLVLLLVLGGILTAAGVKTTTAGTSPQPAASHAASHPHTTSAAPAAAAPNPSGTYNGSCDYTLGDDPVGGTARAIGEVDLHNNGNIGTKVHVRITWPQEGYAPITATRNLRTTPGERTAVRFHEPLPQTEIERLQSWQSNHGYKDGCTYKVVILGTFGAAS